MTVRPVSGIQMGRRLSISVVQVENENHGGLRYRDEYDESYSAILLVVIKGAYRQQQ
jgi:hypothetical protein